MGVTTYSAIQVILGSFIGIAVLLNPTLLPAWMTTLLLLGAVLALVTGIGLWLLKRWGWWASTIVPAFVIYIFIYALIENWALNLTASSLTARSIARFFVASVVMFWLMSARMQERFGVNNISNTIKLCYFVFLSAVIHFFMVVAFVSPPPFMYAMIIAPLLLILFRTLMYRWRLAH